MHGHQNIKHYIISEEINMLAVLSVLFLCVFNTVKNEIRVLFPSYNLSLNWIHKEGADEDEHVTCINSFIWEVYFGHKCICLVTLLWLISVISILQCYFKLHSVVSSRSGNSVWTGPHSDEQGECLKLLVTFCHICICYSFMHP